MKTNPALTDFPSAMVDACHAALDAGIFYNNEFSNFVLRQLGGYGCEAVLMEIAELDAAAENYAAMQRAQHARLEAAVSVAPRGHYAVIRMARANGCHMYTAIASDGYGNGIATGGAYDVYDSMPPGAKILERMIGYEIYLCRKAVEQERARQVGREALAKYGFHIGMTFKDIIVSGQKYTSGAVSEIHPESGSVTLYLVRRGSRNRWKVTLFAQSLAERLNLVKSMERSDSLPRMMFAMEDHQGLLFQ
jgi:hypothetical protein